MDEIRVVIRCRLQQEQQNGKVLDGFMDVNPENKVWILGTDLCC